MSTSSEFMTSAADAVVDSLPHGYRFILLAVPESDRADNDGKLRYISNLEREVAVRVLKEWLIMAGAEEDWMKHIT